MKRCPQCGQTKPLADFNKNRSRPDGHQNVCRGCQNTRDLLDYHHKPGRREAIAATRTHPGREEVAAWYRGLKDMQPCADCGVRYPYYVMQWDHLGGKEFTIAQAFNRQWSRARIEAEIAKCELVCANCHCLRTHERRVRVTIPPSPTLEVG